MIPPHLHQAPVLGNGPLRHLERTRNCKEVCRDALYGNAVQQPSPNLKCIVRAGNEIEQKATWNLVILLSRLAQIREDDM